MTSVAARTRAAENRRGIACLVAAMVCLLLNDTLMKLLGSGLPLAQMVLVRGLIATGLIGLAMLALGQARQLPRLASRHVAARAAADALGTLMYLGALMHLPLANATAINLAAPLVMAVLAALFLGERVRAARWCAIALGFAGVLLVVQPSARGFDGWAVVCLGATLCHSVRELLTRHIDRSVPSVGITLASAVAVTAMAAVATVFGGWQPLSLRALALLAAAAALLATGYFFIVTSMRHGEMSTVAPFRYSALLVALLLGWAVWGHVPDALAWAGITLLLGTGLYLLHDERRRVRAADAAPLA
jgi:drug/metabolite transporter (DMT)-like permease